MCVYDWSTLHLCSGRVASELSQRVAIVDWDVHHGNGTVEVLEGSDYDVLYISIHLWAHGDFYPGSGNPQHVGVSSVLIGLASLTVCMVGRDGSVVNIGWNEQGMGDTEYLAAFDSVVVPLWLLFGSLV